MEPGLVVLIILVAIILIAYIANRTSNAINKSAESKAKDISASEISKLNNEISSLQKENDALKKAYSSLVTESTTTQNTIASYGMQLTETKKQLFSAQEDVRRLAHQNRILSSPQSTQPKQETSIPYSSVPTEEQLVNEIELLRGENSALKKENIRLSAFLVSNDDDNVVRAQSIIQRFMSAENYYLSAKNKNPFFSPALRVKYIKSFSDKRFDNAFFDCPSDPKEISLSAKMMSSDSSQYYTTSLSSCTCTDFQVRKNPCKHMIKLAIFLGATYDIQERDVSPIIETIAHEKQEALSLKNRLDQISSDLSKREKKVIMDEEHAKQCCEEEKRKANIVVAKAKREAQDIENALREKTQSYPWFAEMIAKYRTAKIEANIRDSVTKREMTSILNDRERKIALLENQLAVWKYSFPILDDLQDIAPKDLSAAVSDSTDTGFIYQWLSESEYAALTSEEKQQKYVDDYFQKKSKNAWEAGIKYERYIGYLCEKQGYSVKYNGATMKLDDMGRDLIVTKRNKVFLVQCKRYSSSKEIHENSIFQLFGSICHYESLNQNKKVVGVFVTTTKLTSIAVDCAKKLGITVYENVEFKEYPVIKCNNSKFGELIYHLPFDQQYDKILVDESKGERYVSSVSEAISLGYRHAYKHFVNS